MKHEYMKRIRNAETVDEIKRICSEASLDNINKELSDEAYMDIIEYAGTIIKAITAF